MAEQSSKAMYVLQYLWQNTDDEHSATTSDIVNSASKSGIAINRHSVPVIIEQLQHLGYDIIVIAGSPNKYFIGAREFELPELKLLIDAIESSRFISEKKSNELTEKICRMASIHQAQELRRHLYIDGRVKSDNQTLYYTIDTIHYAINNNRQIRFLYFEYTAEKKKIYKHDGYTYQFSPYALLWHNDCYYVLGYSKKHETITKFRVDRMDKAAITKLNAVEKPKNFDPAIYLKNIFSMYDGKMQNIRLKCDADMMKVIIDRFGVNTQTISCEDGSFITDVNVSISPTFWGWLFGFHGKIRVTAPQKLIQEYTQTLNAEIKRYTT